MDDYDIHDYDLDRLHDAICSIRDLGVCNMFDVTAVQRTAYELESYELVDFIENHRRSYIHFIFHGKFE